MIHLHLFPRHLLYRLIRTRAWLFHGGLVKPEDLTLLAHSGDTLSQMETLAKKIPLLF
jgi:MoxR-like ATPase